MSRIVNWLDAKLYPEFKENWDDWLFRDAILDTLDPSMRVLDLGAGAGILPQMDFRGRVAEMCGVDPDPRVADNPYLDVARQGVGEAIPFDDGYFDLVFADNVLEHLEQPEIVFREVSRVLKSGGVFLAKTPNKWHYVPTIARLTPHSFHELVAGARKRDVEDIFPTVYRANTGGAIRRIAAETGMRVRDIRLIEGRPEYLRISWPTYLAGAAYERTVNWLPFLSWLRVIIIATLEKVSSE